MALSFVAALSAFTNNGTSVAVTIASVTVGDALSASVGQRSGSDGTISAPAGWTLQGVQRNSGTTLGSAIFTKIAEAGDTSGSWTFAVTGANTKLSAVVLVFTPDTGVDVEYLAALGQVNVSAVDIAIPAATIPEGKTVVLRIASASKAHSDEHNQITDWTLPTGGSVATGGGAVGSRNRTSLQYRLAHNNGDAVTVTSTSAADSAGFQLLWGQVDEPGVTGTSASVAPAATAAASGTPEVTGTEAGSAPAATAAAAGTSSVEGSAAASAPAATASAAGSPENVGTGAVSAPAATASAAGTSGVEGSAAGSAPPATASAAGTPAVAGSAAATAPAATVSAAGTTGPALTVTLVEGATVRATWEVDPAALATETLALTSVERDSIVDWHDLRWRFSQFGVQVDVVDIVGEQLAAAVEGTVAASAPAAVASAAGTSEVTGSAAGTAPAARVSASDDGAVSGSVAAGAAAATASAAGTPTVTGAGAAAAPAVEASAAGTSLVTGTGAASAPAAETSAAGSPVVQGDTTATAPGAEASASGAPVATGTGAGVAPPAEAAAAGTPIVSGTATTAASPAQVDANDAQDAEGTVTAEAPAAQVDASGAPVVTGATTAAAAAAQAAAAGTPAVTGQAAVSAAPAGAQAAGSSAVPGSVDATAPAATAAASGTPTVTGVVDAQAPAAVVSAEGSAGGGLMGEIVLSAFVLSTASVTVALGTASADDVTLATASMAIAA